MKIRVIFLCPSIEEACASERYVICGRPKEMPKKPTCLRCWMGPSGPFERAPVRLDYPGFGDMVTDKDLSVQGNAAAWDKWCSLVMAKRN